MNKNDTPVDCTCLPTYLALIGISVSFLVACYLVSIFDVGFDTMGMPSDALFLMVGIGIGVFILYASVETVFFTDWGDLPSHKRVGVLISIVIAALGILFEFGLWALTLMADPH